MAGLEGDSSVKSLLSRFKGGRVALLAVKQALEASTSSSSLHEAASGDSYTEDLRLEERAPVNFSSGARRGSSFSHRSPHAVPQQLEVEYSQASHQSQQSQYTEDADTQPEASWEEPYSPTSEQLAEPRSHGSRSPPGQAPASPCQGQTAAMDWPKLQEQDFPDEALLLCAALNTGCDAGVNLGGSPTRSPVALRLRGQLQRELSGAPLGSPMLARMVSEHSFEEGGEGPQGRRSRLHVMATDTEPDSSGQSCFGSPSQPGPEVGQADTEAGHGAGMIAWPGWQDVGAETRWADESAAPSDEGQEASAHSNSRRLSGVKKAPLHRARTPITTALARDQASSGSSLARISGGDVKGELESVEARSKGLPTKARPASGETQPGAQPRPAGNLHTIKQQVWSFDAIPEGHATIPSSHLAPERRFAGPKAKAHVGPRQKSAAGGAADTCSKARSQQRLLDRSGAGSRPGSANCAAAGHESKAAAAVHQGAATPSSGPTASLVASSKMVVSSQRQLPQATASVAAEDALQDVQGMAALQAQLAVPVAVYSHDRFQQHFDRLSQLLAQRQQRRQQQRDSLIQQVAGFEQSVRAQRVNDSQSSRRNPLQNDLHQQSGGQHNEVDESKREPQLGFSLEPEMCRSLSWTSAMRKAAARSNTAFSEDQAASSGIHRSGEYHNPGALETPQRPVSSAQEVVVEAARQDFQVAPAEKPGIRAGSTGLEADTAICDPSTGAQLPHEGKDLQAARDPQRDAAVSPAGCAAGAPEPECMNRQQGDQVPASLITLHASPEGEAEVLGPHWCRHQLTVAQRKQDAFVRLKPITQVKAEQDLAFKYLGVQQRRYRASPLPLSSVEPRFAEMMERAQQRRTDVHEKRMELLRSQEQPFSFYERDKQRQQAAMAEAGDSTEVRPPAGSPTFLANPIPVSTTEARYALLVAEMQLSNKALGRRSLRPSPAGSASLRPATAGSPQRPFQQQLLLRPRPASSQGCAATLGGSTCGLKEGIGGNQGRLGAVATSTQHDADGRAAVEPSRVAVAACSTVGATGTLEGCCGGSQEQAMAEGSSKPGRRAGLAAEALANTALGNPLWQAEDGLTKPYSCEWCCDVDDAPGQPSDSTAVGRNDIAARAAENAGSTQQCGEGEPLEGEEQQQPRQQEQQENPQQHDCSLQGTGAVSSSTSKALLLARSSPGVGTTRSQQLKLQAVQQGVASGRYATELERASATVQEVRDMALLCSSPKWRRPGSSAVADREPAAVGGDGRVRSAPDTAAGTAASGEELAGVSLHPSPGVPWQNLARSASKLAAGRDATDGQVNSLEDEESGQEYVAAYADKQGMMQDAIDSPQSGSEPKWRLGTEVTLTAEPPRVELQVSKETESAARGPPASPDTGEKRRDTPLPHIAARHKQAEEAAKAEVRKALLKRGMGVYNFVEGQP